MNHLRIEVISQCLLRAAIRNEDKGISRCKLVNKLFGKPISEIVPCVHGERCKQPNKEQIQRFQRQFPEILVKLETIKL